MTGKQRVLAALLGGALSCSLPLNAMAEGISLAGPKGEVKQVTIGPTSPRDTLWRLANAHRPEGATVYQTMLALYQANPQAFSADNLNALEKGMVLTLPDPQTILAIDPAEAKRRATEDDRRWSGEAAKPSPKATAKPSPKAAATADQPQTPAKGQQDSTPPVAAGADSRLGEQVAELSKQLEAQRRQSTEQLAQLRRELGQSIDEMAAMLEQNELLKARLEELNGQIQVLQDALDDQQAVNRELEMQLQAPVATPAGAEVIEPVEEMEESGIWQQLWSKPWLVGLAGVIPTSFILVLIWLFLRRRAPEPDAGIAQISDPDLAPIPEAVASTAAAEPVAESDAPLKSAIQLDPQAQEEEEPVQSLEELLQEHQSKESEQQSEQQPLADDELLANMAINELEPDIDTVMSELGVALDDTNDMVQLSHEEPKEPLTMGAEELDALLKEADEPTVELSPSLPEADAQPTEPAAAEQPGESLLTDAVEPEQGAEFIDIDKLLDDSGSTEPNFEPYSGLELDIGDDGLTELVGDSAGVDVDDEAGGFSAKLDLARAYIEIDDKDSAKALLREVVEKGADAQRQEAQALLDRL